MINNNFIYRLYGRSKGRNKNNKINESVLKKTINNIYKSQYNIVDIGSGYGESSIELARSNQKNIVIACEKYIDGINNIADKAHVESLDNVFIFHGNVHQFFDEHCIEKLISEIWILFPDPWPKKRHFKRRLIDENFFNKVTKYLKKNATIHIASDSKSYISHILNCVHEIRNDFLWVNQRKQEWEYSGLPLPKTKYYKKALENGLNPFYIKLMKL
tara:strand:- start:681 stop:1328 length:648 start_codon:yes stop_codon:yes gene_type:complete